MCRISSVDYGPIPESVPLARRWLTAQLGTWELEQLEPDASLLVTELVTNAVVHAHSEVHVSAAVADGILEVAVSDHEPQLPMPHSHETALATNDANDAEIAEGGRGMELVDVIADEWGVAVLGAGKQVWFRLSVAESWAHRTACPCHGEDLQRTRLASGRFAIAVAGAWDK